MAMESPVRKNGSRRGASLLVMAFQEWVRDRCEGLAAAMTFNLILAAPCFFAVILAACARVFGEPWTKANVVPVLRGWVGPRGQNVITGLLAHTRELDVPALFSLGILVALGLILGASGFFLQVEDGLQIIWDVRREQAGVSQQLKKRFFGLLYALGSIAIAVIGVLAAALLFRVENTARPFTEDVRHATKVVLAFVTLWAVATFWLKAMPPVRLTLGQVLPWSALIAALHLVGRLVLAIIAPRPAPFSDIDMAQSFILLLLWSYYASMVFLYGAELMRVYLQRTGTVTPPRST